MGTLRTLRRSSRVIREHLGLRRFLKLADPLLGKEIHCIHSGSCRERVLVVAPHADDEAIGCGGAIALHRRRGDEVKVVYTTDSSFPLKGQSRDPTYRETRKKEAGRSLEILGGTDATFLDLPDKEGDVDEKAIRSLIDVVRDVEPHRIYVPWMLDGHPDHRAAFEMVALALRSLPTDPSLTVWQYEVWTPLVANRYVPIRDVLELKRAAIEAHASQVAQHDYAASSLGLASYRGVQGGVDGPAEAYFAVLASKLQAFADL